MIRLIVTRRTKAGTQSQQTYNVLDLERLALPLQSLKRQPDVKRIETYVLLEDWRAPFDK